MKNLIVVILILNGLSVQSVLTGQPQIKPLANIKLADMRWRDVCFLYKGKIEKLYMLWASGGAEGYTEGISISESGKLAGPWAQQTEPLYSHDGGHAMVFTSFEGKLMMVLHSPNNRESRPRIFEMEDTGNTLHILKELKNK